MIARWAGSCGKTLGVLALVGSTASAKAQTPFTSELRYDQHGWLTGTIAPDPDGAGPLGRPAVRNKYDATGQLVETEEGELSTWKAPDVAPGAWGTAFVVRNTQRWVYDQYGQRIKVASEAAGVVYTVTQYSYDSRRRLACTAVRMNPTTYSSLPSDACAQAAQGSFGADRIERQTYNVFNGVIRIERGLGTPLSQTYVSYTRYIDGRIASVTDANGNYATIDYDYAWRPIKWTFSSPATTGQVNAADYESYQYDAAGNRTIWRKRDGRTFTYGYDALNRMTSKIVPDGCAPTQVGACPPASATRDVYYGYDLRGLQTYARFDGDTGEGVTNAYDGFGQLTSTTTNMGGNSWALSYRYDANGNRTQLIHPGNTVFEYIFDGLDRLKEVRDPYQAVAILSYDAAGRLKQRSQYGQADYVYDGIGLLSSLTLGWPTSTEVAWGYSRNPAGQMVTRTASNDAYAFTAAMNRSNAYTVNGLNQYTAVAGQGYGYDANGNLTSDGGIAFGYDAENRLIKATGARTGVLEYDPLGRLWRTSGGPSGTTQFIYDGDDLVLALDGNGAMIDRYLHGIGDDVPLVDYLPNGVRFLYANEQGSVVWLSGQFGAGSARNSYDEYGVPDTATFTGRFGYTGQAWLPDLGMWYYKARIYAPMLGRFMQTDPIGYADQINLYAYVANDPVNRTDPSGEDSYVVGRPLDNAALAAARLGHAFIVVDAKYPGDPNARIISFGKLADGKMGNVNDASRAADISKPAHATDIAAWRSLAGSKEGSFSRIDAPDKVVAAVAGAVSEKNDYSIVPRATSPFGDAVNSNSAARGVADASTGLTGGRDTAKPGGLGLPGWNESGRVKIDGAKLCSSDGIKCN